MASPFCFSVCKFINLNAFVAWDPGYVNVGVIVFLQKLMGMFGEHDGKLLGRVSMGERDVGDGQGAVGEELNGFNVRVVIGKVFGQ